MFDMVRNSGPVAIAVLVLLLIASLYSWAVILGKSATFRRARTQSRRFMRAFRKADRLQEIAAVSEQFKPSPLVTVFDEVYDTYRRQTGGFGPPKNIVTLERTAQAAARAHELALRVSIGAGRWRLVQLVLVESAWLAFLAAAIGGFFASWAAPFVVSRINPPGNSARLFLPAASPA